MHVSSPRSRSKKLVHPNLRELPHHSNRIVRSRCEDDWTLRVCAGGSFDWKCCEWEGGEKEGVRGWVVEIVSVVSGRGVRRRG